MGSSTKIFLSGRPQRDRQLRLDPSPLRGKLRWDPCLQRAGAGKRGKIGFVSAGSAGLFIS